jgi:hypothetical protein
MMVAGRAGAHKRDDSVRAGRVARSHTSPGRGRGRGPAPILAEPSLTAKLPAGAAARPGAAAGHARRLPAQSSDAVELLHERRHDLEDVADDAVVGQREDRRFFVLVHRRDQL